MFPEAWVLKENQARREIVDLLESKVLQDLEEPEVTTDLRVMLELKEHLENLVLLDLQDHLETTATKETMVLPDHKEIVDHLDLWVKPDLQADLVDVVPLDLKDLKVVSEKREQRVKAAQLEALETVELLDHEDLLEKMVSKEDKVYPDPRDHLVLLVHLDLKDLLDQWEHKA